MRMRIGGPNQTLREGRQVLCSFGAMRSLTGFAPSAARSRQESPSPLSTGPAMSSIAIPAALRIVLRPAPAALEVEVLKTRGGRGGRCPSVHAMFDETLPCCGVYRLSVRKKHALKALAAGQDNSVAASAWMSSAGSYG